MPTPTDFIAFCEKVGGKPLTPQQRLLATALAESAHKHIVFAPTPRTGRRKTLTPNKSVRTPMPNDEHSPKLSVVITKSPGTLDKSRSVVWLCTLCGKEGANRMQVNIQGSKSCYKHAVPVYSDTIRRDAHEVRAIRAPEPKEQTRDPAWTYRPG